MYRFAVSAFVVGAALVAQPIGRAYAFTYNATNGNDNLIMGTASDDGCLYICNVTTGVRVSPFGAGACDSGRTGLTVDSRVNLLDGNDIFNVVDFNDAATSCGSYTFTAAQYNSRLLTVVAGRGNDQVYGTSQREIIWGDHLTDPGLCEGAAPAGSYDDVLDGFVGDDEIYGCFGFDRIRLTTSSPAWRIRGGSGNDCLAINFGQTVPTAVQLTCGPGTDRVGRISYYPDGLPREDGDAPPYDVPLLGPAPHACESYEPPGPTTCGFSF